MTHKNDGFIENLMKVPAPLKLIFIPFNEIYKKKMYIGFLVIIYKIHS